MLNDLCAREKPLHIVHQVNAMNSMRVGSEKKIIITIYNRNESNRMPKGKDELEDFSVILFGVVVKAAKKYAIGMYAEHTHTLFAFNLNICDDLRFSFFLFILNVWKYYCPFCI